MWGQRVGSCFVLNKVLLISQCACWCCAVAVCDSGIEIKQDGVCDSRTASVRGDESFECFFHEKEANGEHSVLEPRAVFIDLEPSILDEIKSGPLRQLFNPSNFISGKEAVNTFPRGYFSDEILNSVLDSIRKQAECCNGLRGFNISHSFGGGTGSGFTSKLLERLSELYGKKYKQCHAVYPSSEQATSVIEPYNSVLVANTLLEHSDLVLMFDNAAIHDICRNKLQIERPSYNNINQLIAQVVSNTTHDLRFYRLDRNEPDTWQTNLVPFPKFHFVLCSHAPVSVNKSHETPSISELTSEVFNSSNVMAKCDPRQGKYMAITLHYRGDIVAKEVNEVLRPIRSTIDWVDWASNGLRATMAHSRLFDVSGEQPVNRSLTMLANTTSMGEILERSSSKFDALYDKRAFVHWFVGEGMDEKWLREARENLLDVEQCYREVYYDDEELTASHA